MTNQEAIEMLTAKAECIRREASGIDVDCNHRNCDECELCYAQGTMSDQMEALGVAISALQAQDSKTKRCATCKHNPPSKKWPCEDCDMRESADRWEPKEAKDSSLTQKGLDTISRTAAIDIFDDYNVSVENGELEAYSRDRKRLCDLPSAQPEIVRCKDCKYGEQDEVGRWFCRSLGCQIGDEDGSGFCADAERRTDA